MALRQTLQAYHDWVIDDGISGSCLTEEYESDQLVRLSDKPAGHPYGLGAAPRSGPRAPSVCNRPRRLQASLFDELGVNAPMLQQTIRSAVKAKIDEEH